MIVPSTYEDLKQLLSDEHARTIIQRVYTSHDIATLESLLQNDPQQVTDLLTEARRLAGGNKKLTLDILLRVVLLSPQELAEAYVYASYHQVAERKTET